MELKLLPPPRKPGDVPGYIAIRCRRATDYDKHFMTELNRPEKGDALGLGKLDMESKGGAGAIASILTRKAKVVKHGKNAGQKVVS